MLIIKITDHKIYQKYLELNNSIQQFDNISLPLCASENILSPFVKLPLGKFSHEKYLLGSIENYERKGNFVGSKQLHEIFKLIALQAKNLFGFDYVDARTLSGLHCVTTLLMALTNNGDKILLSSIESGGHSSMEIIAGRLGLQIIYAPYDFSEYDYNYEEINNILNNNKIKLILLSPSNIIYPPKLERIEVNNEFLVYDASQTLGLIGSGRLPNPLIQNKDIICIGSTHKTLPGPSAGLIMTNNSLAISLLDSQINPSLVSCVQLENKVVLLHSLIELELVGEAYGNCIQKNILYLCKKLDDIVYFDVICDGKSYSQTHQILLGISPDTYKNIELNSLIYNITINLSSKRNLLFNNKLGMRIGLQEISRYHWGEEELDMIVEILYQLCLENPSPIILDYLDKLNVRKNLFFVVS